MLSIYIGVYKALYDYAAQSEEELTLHADDLLYLLERSDIDDWWKVKKREVAVGDEEVEEPSGLVPSNYIEAAPVLQTAVALYDYDKQTEEELLFKEGDRFNVYDLADPDWLLVGDMLGQTYGFVPANYIEMAAAAAPAAPAAPAAVVPAAVTPAAAGAPTAAPVPISAFAPPPQHRDRSTTALPSVLPPPQHPQREREERKQEYGEREERSRDSGSTHEAAPPKPQRPRDDDDAPPPMPTRPQLESGRSRSASNAESHYEDEETVDVPNHKFDGDYFTWYINEVDGRRKRAITLLVGRGLLILKPTASTSKLSLKLASSIDQQWKIRDLRSFSNEKKHLFLELEHPQASIELHTGTKDVAEAIVSILGEIKGADSVRGLTEVARALVPSNSGRRIGKLLYDFEAQGDDELACKEGDEVYIVDESKSKDWWMVQNIDTERQGIVPSSYIEIIGSSNLDKLTEQPLRQRLKKSSKGRVVGHRLRDERERVREKDRAQRDKERAKAPRGADDKSMPNSHRVRTWIDSSGSFKVEAEFLGCVEGKIHLHKTNGVKIAVGATKLSIEDLEYVEKVTGTSLATYKAEVQRQNAKRQKGRLGVSAINDVGEPARPSAKSKPTAAVSEPDYDWFEFFLSCGVDIGNCQRYSLNFSREQMDENILQDISPSLLRTLGLREGDILRVMKVLDAKFNRSGGSGGGSGSGNGGGSGGGLFTEAGGALKNNNSSSEIAKVDARALPSPLKQDTLLPTKFEDDAWAVKPAARSTEDLLKPQATLSRPVTPQYTGALQDLVNIKPLEANANKPMPQLPLEPSAPALQPVKTGPQKGALVPVPAQRTGGLVPVPAQRTGGFVPVQQTGGLLAAQPTGFVPITAQPTGFLPIQATGGLVPQLTIGIVPLQTGATTFQPQPQPQPQQRTGGFSPMPSTTFGQQQTGGFVPLQTGTFTGPPPLAMSFGQLSLQQTGPMVPAQRTGPAMPQTSFGGGVQPQTGQSTGVQPQSTFGQSTGSAFPQTFGQQPTGGTLSQTFGQQRTGGAFPQTFGQSTGDAFPQTFGQPTGGTFQPQSTFGQQIFGQNNGQPQNTFGQLQPNLFQPQASFEPQPFQLQPTFGQFSQPQTSFGQPSYNQFGQSPAVGQVTNMFQNASISSPPPQQFPNTTFGQQPQFDGFNSQPLQSQPTGAGFGNAPLQPQQTGKRANLQAATASNPFGF